MTPRCLVLPGQHHRAWAGPGSRASSWPQTPISVALHAPWTTDAHLVGYWIETLGGDVPDEAPRVRVTAQDALEASGYRVRTASVLLDVDLHGADGAQVESFSARFLADLAGLPDYLASSLSWYRSRGGLRLVWVFSDAVSSYRWPRVRDHIVNAVVAATGIHASAPGSKARKELPAGPRLDVFPLWQPYRLPFVVRDGAPLRFPAHLSGLDRPLDLALLHLPDEDAPVDQTDASDIDNESELVHDGEGRDPHLFRFACTLRGQGLSEDAILAGLRVENADHVVPPHDEARLTKIAASAARYPAGGRFCPRGEERPALLVGSQKEVADLLLARYDGRGAPCVGDRGALWWYNKETGAWQEIKQAEGVGYVASLDGAPIPSGKQVRPLSVSREFATNTCDLARILRDRPGFFSSRRDATPGMAFRNGFVSFEPGPVLREHSPMHRAIAHFDFDFVPGARGPTFEKLIGDSLGRDDDGYALQRLLRDFVGACLLGQATEFEKALFLLGVKAANGKSRILRVVSALAPKAAITSVAPQSLNNEYQRALLAESLINIVGEVPSTAVLDGEPFKSFVSGDSVTARRIYGAPFTFEPRAGHLFSANATPPTTDATDGFWRRFIVIPFNHVVPVHERDPWIAERIIEHELAAVAAWAVEGAAAMTARRRYEIPESANAALARWRRDADPVAGFLDELTVPDPKAVVKLQLAFERFLGWSTANNRRLTSQTTFAHRLVIHGYAVSRGGGVNTVKGLRLA